MVIIVCCAPLLGSELVWAAQIAPTHFNYCQLLLSSTPRAGAFLCNYKFLYCFWLIRPLNVHGALRFLFTEECKWIILTHSSIRPAVSVTTGLGAGVSLLVMMIMRAMIARLGPGPQILLSWLLTVNRTILFQTVKHELSSQLISSLLQTQRWVSCCTLVQKIPVTFWVV